MRKGKPSKGEIREEISPDGRRLLAGTNQRWEPDGGAQETDLDEGWTVREEFAVQNGKRVVSALTIRPTRSGIVPPGGVTARLLRRVRVGQFAAELRRELAGFFGKDAAAHIFDGIGWESRRSRRAKRPRADDVFYAKLAHAYAKACLGASTPTATLAAAYRVPSGRMKSYINLARRNGFLTPTEQGRAGGKPTEKAIQVIERETRGRRKK